MAELVDPQTGETLAQGQHSVTHKTTNAIIMQLLVNFSEQSSWLRRILQSTTYARTSTDAMRVNVDNTVTAATYTRWGANGAYAAFYAEGSPMSVDAREPLRLMHRQLMNERMRKWTYT